jgi:hypothetical protein
MKKYQAPEPVWTYGAEYKKCRDPKMHLDEPVMHFTLFYTIEPGSLHRSCSFMELASQCMGAAPIAAFIA